MLVSNRSAYSQAYSLGGAVREAKQPKVREWCFRIHNESKLGGQEKCHPTRAACEEDAGSWLGADKKKSCYGKK